MTATLPEAGQDAPGEPPDPEAHFRALAAAMAEVDKWTHQLIVDELAGICPALDQAEEQAAAALRQAVAALEDPERATAELDGEITRAEAELSSWRSQLEDGDVGARVTARTWVSEWEAELAALRNKRDFAQAEMLPLIAARNKARADLELAMGAKRGLAWSMIDPFGTAVGQGTSAYVSYRMPRLTYVMLMGDRGHPEWDCALAELRELCVAVMRAGHDITRDLPDFGEVAFRSMTSALDGNLADVMADPAPTGRDVMNQIEAEAVNKNLPASYIEDHRNIAPVPRVARDWMQVPWRS